MASKHMTSRKSSKYIDTTFQQKLLTQQLDAQEKSDRELMTWLEKSFLVGILTRWNTTFQKEIYPMISPTLDKLDRAPDKAAGVPPKNSRSTIPRPGKNSRDIEESSASS